MVSRIQGRKAVASTAFKTALPRTLPVCITFFLLALSYGVLMGTRGFSFLWPMCMSAFIFTGSMEFVTVNLLVSAFNPFATFMLAVMLGTRHLFYGISMLGRFKNMGVKKPYLIFSLCDETFAIDNGTVIPKGVNRGWFYFFVGFLNQFSWGGWCHGWRHSRRTYHVRYLRTRFHYDRHVRRDLRRPVAGYET